MKRPVDFTNLLGLEGRVFNCVCGHKPISAKIPLLLQPHTLLPPGLSRVSSHANHLGLGFKMLWVWEASGTAVGGERQEQIIH